MRELLRKIAKKGASFLPHLFLRLLEHTAMTALGDERRRRWRNSLVRYAVSVDWAPRLLWLLARNEFFMNDWVE
jgi:hypothetical protein